MSFRVCSIGAADFALVLESIFLLVRPCKHETVDLLASLLQRNKAPLSPVTCSLALLPAEGGQNHALKGLRPLMQQSSAIADLYNVCPTCKELEGKIRVNNARLLAVCPSLNARVF